MVLKKRVLDIKRCHRWPPLTWSTDEESNILSGTVVWFTSAALFTIFSASSNRPLLISHLGDSGINLGHTYSATTLKEKILEFNTSYPTTTLARRVYLVTTDGSYRHCNVMPWGRRQGRCPGDGVRGWDDRQDV